MKNTFTLYSNHLGEQLSQEDILTIVENLAFCLTDEKGYFLEVNPAYCQLYGYDENELIGKHFTMVVPMEYREVAASIHDEFIGGKEEMPAEWTVQDKNGNLMHIKAEAIRCVSSGGTTTKMTLIEKLS